MDRASFGAKLRAYRSRCNLKQGDLADLLGVSQAYVSRLEAGSSPSTDELEGKLARLLSSQDGKPFFELWREAIKSSPALLSIVRHRDGQTVFVEISQGLRALGGPFSEIEFDQPVGTICDQLDLDV